MDQGTVTKMIPQNTSIKRESINPISSSSWCGLAKLIRKQDNAGISKYDVGKVKTAEGQQFLLLAKVIKPIPIKREEKEKEKRKAGRIFCIPVKSSKIQLF